MTTENPNPNEQTADAAETGEDTALAAAANAAEASADADEADKGTDPDKADVADKDKGADEKGEAPELLGAPEEYDVSAFTMPEGLEFDSEAFEAVKDDLKGMNLSQAGAGKIVDLFATKIVPLIQSRTEAKMDDAAAELRANLARDLQADKEVGGKNLEESRSFAAKAIAHFIPDKDERNAFSTFLNESGLGNHPLLMRLVAGAGKAVSEATTLEADRSAAPVSESEKFYPKAQKG